MILGGSATIPYLGVQTMTPGQRIQAVVEGASRANDQYTDQTGANVVQNRQRQVDRLQGAVSRGQLLDLQV